MKTCFTAASAALMLTACVADEERIDLSAHAYKGEGLTVVSNHPDVLNTYIKRPGSGHRYCLKPDPDVAVDYTSSFGLGGGANAVSGKFSADDGAGDKALGGRSQNVLMAREMLYRACELSLNVNADKNETIAIYEKTLRSLERMLAADQGR